MARLHVSELSNDQRLDCVARGLHFHADLPEREFYVRKKEADDREDELTARLAAWNIGPSSHQEGETNGDYSFLPLVCS